MIASSVQPASFCWQLPDKLRRPPNPVLQLVIVINAFRLDQYPVLHRLPGDVEHFVVRRRSASAPWAGPSRAMREFFQTPTSMLPLSRKHTAVFGRACFPVLKMFFANATSTRILSDCVSLAARQRLRASSSQGKGGDQAVTPPESKCVE